MQIEYWILTCKVLNSVTAISAYSAISPLLSTAMWRSVANHQASLYAPICRMCRCAPMRVLYGPCQKFNVVWPAKTGQIILKTGLYFIPEEFQNFCVDRTAYKVKGAQKIGVWNVEKGIVFLRVESLRTFSEKYIAFLSAVCLLLHPKQALWLLPFSHNQILWRLSLTWRRGQLGCKHSWDHLRKIDDNLPYS